ncbi:MAG: glycosyltransferase [Candidatus Uhrbacteria bacterium]
MRVLLANKFWYPKGGSERYTFLLKDLLEAHGHEVVPFAMDDERNVASEWAEYFVPHVDFWDAEDAVPNQTALLKKLSRVVWSLDAQDRMRTLLDAVKPDIVHLQNFAHQISPSILPVIAERGIPIVWTLHDYKIMCPNYRMYSKGMPCERCKRRKYWNAPLRNCMGSVGASAAVAFEMFVHHAVLNVYGKHLGAVVAPSRFLATKLADWGWKGRVEMIPNFITRDAGCETLDAVSLSNTNQSTSGAPVLFVGRLAEEKGVEEFLAAARRLREISFELIGDGPLLEHCKDQEERCTNLRCWGRLSSEEVLERLAEASILVVPSRWYENAPYVVLEAMQLGIPVIASNIGGLPELVRDNVTGRLVAPGDARVLEDTIAQLYGNSIQRRTFGERARAIVESEYGPITHIERLSSLYASLLSK